MHLHVYAPCVYTSLCVCSGCRLCVAADVAAVPRYRRGCRTPSTTSPHDMIYQPCLLLYALSLPSLFVFLSISLASLSRRSVPLFVRFSPVLSSILDRRCARLPCASRPGTTKCGTLNACANERAPADSTLGGTDLARED